MASVRVETPKCPWPPPPERQRFYTTKTHGKPSKPVCLLIQVLLPPAIEACPADAEVTECLRHVAGLLRVIENPPATFGLFACSTHRHTSWPTDASLKVSSQLVHSYSTSLGMKNSDVDTLVAEKRETMKHSASRVDPKSNSAPSHY
jgi:hypothetical protein